MFRNPPTQAKHRSQPRQNRAISMISRRFNQHFPIFLGVKRKSCVCGTVISEMKNVFYPCAIAIAILFFASSCGDDSIVPPSATDKITALVVQAENETQQIQSSIDLTAASISIENLALSADYFVDEQHLEPLVKLDTSAQNHPWKKACNNDFLKANGFGQCLQNLNLSESQRETLEETLEDYANKQKPILNDEYQQFVDLKSQYQSRIAADIDSLQRGNIDNQTFQNKMKQYQTTFIDAFSRQRNANKNLSMLSVNYRSALETIQSTLSESQFKQFYVCHKR